MPSHVSLTLSLSLSLSLVYPTAPAALSSGDDMDDEDVVQEQRAAEYDASVVDSDGSFSTRALC